MIVKIQRYGGNQRCWLIDNIAKISISESLKKPGIKGDNPEDPFWDVQIWDVPQMCSCDNDSGCQDCVNYIELVCRKADGEEFIISFDTIAYIMNDQGSTIEKVVANYYNKATKKRTLKTSS